MTSFPTNTEFDGAALRQAYGVFPSGVVAVAAVVDGVQIGMAASSFRSESLEPALVSVSMAKSSSTWPVLRKAERLGVTVMGEHHGLAARQLAGPADKRFEGLDIAISEEGALVLADGVAKYDTTIYGELDAGDHVIVLLEVKAVETSTETPLLFVRSGFAAIAPSA